MTKIIEVLLDGRIYDPKVAKKLKRFALLRDFEFECHEEQKKKAFFLHMGMFEKQKTRSMCVRCKLREDQP